MPHLTELENYIHGESCNCGYEFARCKDRLRPQWHKTVRMAAWLDRFTEDAIAASKVKQPRAYFKTAKEYKAAK